jgi:glycosyltransferase involved in cell wall biosynthesis
MILPVIKEIMEKHGNVEFHFAGEIDIPEELGDLKERIVATPFVGWQKLPELIASVDINIVPLTKTVFNEAKSENKWVEAALVKVPTIASNLGAFAERIEDGKTGFLCDDNDWLSTLEKLIGNKKLRDEIARNAYNYVVKHCLTIYTGISLAKYLQNKMTSNIAFVLPSTNISGGVLVALKHCVMLKKAGLDVLIINESFGDEDIIKDFEKLYVLSTHTCQFHGKFDKAVATLWTTVTFVSMYLNIGKRYYIVQNYETDFYRAGDIQRIWAQQTYRNVVPLKYITISKWCEKWLKDSFERNAEYAPNGVDLELFTPEKRNFSGVGKIRILVEGNCNDYYKNVDESFKIIRKLDKCKYEIWYMSYSAGPKKWYYINKFLHKIPNELVPRVYKQCHILIKSSILESFSYPPLEMMATGGYSIVAANEGNVEYLKDRCNCLLYNQGDIDGAVKAIEELCGDELLRETLYINGVETARERSWETIQKDILRLYDVAV